MARKEPLNKFLFEFDFVTLGKGGMIQGRHGKIEVNTIASLEDLTGSLERAPGIEHYLKSEMQGHIKKDVFMI